MAVELAPVLTDEQAMLVDASVRVMESEIPLSRIRACADGAAPADATYGGVAAELGWFSMLIDEARGGGSASGNGLLDTALIAAERGARLQPGPFVGHCVVVDAISRARSGAHADTLSDLVSGGTWASWTFGAQDSCELRNTDGEVRLDGSTGVVADGPDCGWLLVTATGAEGLAEICLRVDRPGVAVQPLEGLDVTRRWCRFEFDGVPVRHDDFVATPGGETEQLVARQAQVAAVLSAAESVGAMQADFELALQYAKDRIAFGRPIGSFQAIKHLLADTSLWLEMAKGLVGSAAAALGSDRPDGPELAHAAKAFVAERGVELAHNCFQVFGGIGYTWEHDQHLYFRRLAADAECFGSVAWHRAQLLDRAREM